MASEPTAQPTFDLTPSDLATIVTVNEARASAGLGPLVGPEGLLTIAEYKAKNATTVAAAANAEEGAAAPSPTPETP